MYICTYVFHFGKDVLNSYGEDLMYTLWRTVECLALEVSWGCGNENVYKEQRKKK